MVDVTSGPGRSARPGDPVSREAGIREGAFAGGEDWPARGDPVLDDPGWETGGPDSAVRDSDGWDDGGWDDSGGWEAGYRPVGGRATPPGRWRGVVDVVRDRLPVTLRGAVVAPATRAALVLALVALAAAVVTAWFAWQHRPVPLVVSSGSAAGSARSPLPASLNRGSAPAADSVADPGFSAGTGTEAPPAAAGSAGAAASGPGTGAAAAVVVDVAGRVARPGVVRLPAGSRVVDAIDQAGGVLPGTDTTGLPLARLLVDGEQILVDGRPGPAPPPAAEAGPAPAGGAGGAPAAGPVDLNSATVDQLDGLPGVGPVLAQRIVEWRRTHGPFASPDQLAEVTGFGDKRLADLLPLVTV